MKPILFNTEMVRATSRGRKTATRRAVRKFSDTKGVRINKTERGEFYVDVNGQPTDFQLHPPYLPGDILYVREKWAQPFLPDSDEIHYYADYNNDDTVLREGPYSDTVKVSAVKWRPSIFMPRSAARIFLRVTDVRVERLQEITDEGARAEGVSHIGAPRTQFAVLWETTIGEKGHTEYGWAANPWVWVIEFERCKEPEAEI